MMNPNLSRDSEEPLKFDTLLGRDIEHANERRTSVRGGYFSNSTAVASNYLMVSGIHYAEFHIAAGKPHIGIVRPMPNLNPARYANDYFLFFKRSLHDDFLAARTDEWGSGNVHACICSTLSGRMSWINWDRGWSDWPGEMLLGEDWEGMEGCSFGDTLGLLLNFDKGTLTVYKNNRRLGVMKDGLSGSYCWFATLVGRSAVAIKRGEPPGHKDEV